VAESPTLAGLGHPHKAKEPKKEKKQRFRGFGPWGGLGVVWPPLWATRWFGNSQEREREKFRGFGPWGWFSHPWTGRSQPSPRVKEREKKKFRGFWHLGADTVASATPRLAKKGGSFFSFFYFLFFIF